MGDVTSIIDIWSIKTVPVGLYMTLLDTLKIGVIGGTNVFLNGETAVIDNQHNLMYDFPFLTELKYGPH